MSAPFTPLRELRRRAGKSQAQLAAALCITRSAYSKLERGLTELTVKRAGQIAQILKIFITELLPMPTPNPEQIGTPAAELLYLRAAAEHSVLDAYIRAGMGYEEQIPFDELDENCWIYLTICEIKTREEYEAAGVLITRPAPGGEQAAFEQILRDPGIYSLFQHNTISDEFLLGFWQVFQAKGTPYFEYEDKPFGALTKRLLSNEHDATDSAAMLSSWPEPLLFDPEPEPDAVEVPHRPVYQPGLLIEENPEEIQASMNAMSRINWREVIQTSEARNIAWELDQVVFHEPDPAFAHLREDPAEYARTLTRLVGMAWVMDSLTEEQSSIDVLQEEAARLTSEAYSAEFQAACERFEVNQRKAFT
ncbi:MAG: helix-turn-helix transcriptional regulator [Bacteroidota bacterium]|nr:helix-turn-helix transcriptional regulator [Bacteroidota bacterium]